MGRSGSTFGRVVRTGTTATGASTIRADVVVPATELAGPGVTAHFLHGSATPLAYPDPGDAPDFGAGFPPVGGCQLSYLMIAPGANGAYFSFIQTALGELADQDRPGFHWTPTLDLVLVLAGQLRLEVDDGHVDLGVGDVVAQNATVHRWSNCGEVPTVLAAISLGARPRPDDSADH
jgi:mannose-6-phosphate isomerase-like protein (cupin superfamily)